MDDFERELKIGFLDEARDLLTNAEQCFLNLENAKGDPTIIEQIFRLAHNLKGSAGAVGFNDLKDFTHKLESLLLKIKNGEIKITSSTISLLLKCNDFLSSTIETLKNNLEAKHSNPELMSEIDSCMSGKLEEVETLPNLEVSNQENRPLAAAASSDESIRVSLEKIDQLVNIMGEIVILQTMMEQQKIKAGSSLIQKTICQMSKNIKEAQAISMSLRMIPVKQTFQKMQRIVRDTSKAVGKEVNFTFSGEETENGSIAICFSEKIFLAAMSNMLGEQYTEITKDLEDGAGELLNMIFGQAKIVLNESGHKIEKALPSVIRGQSLVIRPTPETQTIVLPFESQFGQFYLEIAAKSNS